MPRPQVIRKLREAELMRGEGKTAAEVDEGAGGVRGHVPPLAGSVRRDEGRRCEAVEGSGEGERRSSAWSRTRSSRSSLTRRSRRETFEPGPEA